MFLYGNFLTGPRTHTHERVIVLFFDLVTSAGVSHVKNSPRAFVQTAVVNAYAYMYKVFSNQVLGQLIEMSLTGNMTGLRMFGLVSGFMCICNSEN